MNLLDWVHVRTALDWNRRLMQQPPGALCRRCGSKNPFALVLKRRPVICYRCRARQRGLSGVELQDLGGRRSPLPRVPIDGNMHRVLTYLQLSWRRLGVPPRSPAAVAFDLLALVLVNEVWREDQDDPV